MPQLQLLYSYDRFIEDSKNYYGKHSFEVYYKDKFCYKISHFKTNKWFRHLYEFNIKIENDSIKTLLNIIGKDKFKYSINAPI